MLEPIRHILSKQRIILASTSPRRHDILKGIGLQFEVKPSNFEEKLEKESFSHPCEYVKENAKQKAIEVWRRLTADGEKVDLVIGGDTVVTLDECVCEKPKDEENAFHMLSKLSGQKHTVFTGVALVTRPPLDADTGNSSSSVVSGADDCPHSPNSQCSDYVVTTFHEATDVIMCEMSANIINAYIKTGEPMDKAGAYGIQGIGGTLIEGIRGDFYNVMGFPVHRFCKELYHLYLE
ncbi:N-acetylserotonin O-methyltransferase-like protein [Leptotrombidium deliense]|uniref:N-acetylserotonin O-methyltransferase-like protein n=1 Tax=Leptotrombidium deliense TaxID=299467 RepID=A0A443SJ83_9ACAR|nr:N-acetylserotonin O-methyltransferase-like protein [Leptotrombidium deliense]